MDELTVKKLERIALSLRKFLELHPDEQSWLYPMLGRSEKRAITVLEEIEGHSLSYEEIAKLTDSHVNTIKSVLYALEKGGVVLKSGTTGKWMTPKGGRNRRLKGLKGTQS